MSLLMSAASNSSRHALQSSWLIVSILENGREDPGFVHAIRNDEADDDVKLDYEINEITISST